MVDYHSIKWEEVKKNQILKGGYDQTIYTFDIETSSGYIPPGALVAHAFDYSKKPAYYRECTKVALCYLWQFGIGDNYYFGREITDFLPVLKELDKLPGKKICYIHNAAFELCFLLNIFFPDKIFAKKAHKPVYFEYGTIQFRCSYMLTNLSLASWAKQIGAPPKLADYDYDKIRTPLSPLTPFEMEYGQRDIEIVRFGIEKMLQQYGTIQKIPLTQTSRIRRETNGLFDKDMRYRYKMARLLPKDAVEYIRLRMGFAGGNTHTNWYYAGVLLTKEETGGVSDVDIASSYPTEAVTEPLPMSPFRLAKKPERYLHNKKYRCLMEVELCDLKSCMYVDYISYSKVYDIAKKADFVTGKETEDIIVENGKINYIKSGKMIITDCDYDIISQAYTGEIKILRLWYSRAGRLDKRYVEFILDLYEGKTSLKGVEGMEDIYMNKKQLINGIYGDFVSALCYPDTILEESGEWEEIEKSPREINERLQYLREKPYKLKSSFAWGVWITAAARRDHFRIISLIENLEGSEKDLSRQNNHVVYYDTDSVYYLGDHSKEIKKYNEWNRKRCDEAMEELGIDPERTRPKDKYGVVHQLGELDQEKKNLPEFKAIRAKCYGYRDHDGSLHTTISGVSKKYGAHALHGNLDNLSDDLTFSYHECGRKVSTYNKEQPPCIWIDEEGKVYPSTYKFGLNLQPTEYKLTLPQEFLETLALLGSLSTKLASSTIDKLSKMEKAGH